MGSRDAGLSPGVLLYCIQMSFGRAFRRTFARTTSAALRLVVAGVVLTSAATAGHAYVYCQAMQATISHACCAGSTNARQAERAAVRSDCCQSRSVASLGTWTKNDARAPELIAPVVSFPTAHALALATVPTPQAWLDRALAMRTGPPRGRLHLQLMVFHI